MDANAWLSFKLPKKYKKNLTFCIYTVLVKGKTAAFGKHNNCVCNCGLMRCGSRPLSTVDRGRKVNPDPFLPLTSVVDRPNSGIQWKPPHIVFSFIKEGLSREGSH